MLPASVEVNPNVALVLVLVSGGAEVMFVSGGIVSTTVQLKLAGVGSVFPAGGFSLNRYLVARGDYENNPAIGSPW